MGFPLFLTIPPPTACGVKPPLAGDFGAACYSPRLPPAVSTRRWRGTSARLAIPPAYRLRCLTVAGGGLQRGLLFPPPAGSVSCGENTWICQVLASPAGKYVDLSGARLCSTFFFSISPPSGSRPTAAAWQPSSMPCLALHRPSIRTDASCGRLADPAA